MDILPLLPSFQQSQTAIALPIMRIKKGVLGGLTEISLFFYKNKERSRLFRPTDNADCSPPTHPPVYGIENYT